MEGLDYKGREIVMEFTRVYSQIGEEETDVSSTRLDFLIWLYGGEKNIPSWRLSFANGE